MTKPLTDAQKAAKARRKRKAKRRLALSKQKRRPFDARDVDWAKR